MIDATKWRVPAGSLVVDVSLVVALIYGGGKLTERLDDMSRRLEAVEQQKIQPDADRRLAVLEASAITDARWKERIEQKIDQLLTADKRR
jgi:hypothetical protein